jgi:hypothetical protein
VGKQNGNCDFRDSKDKDRNDKNCRLGETE